MKIFIGLNNIASIFYDIKKGFEDLGAETLVISRFRPISDIISEYSDYNTARVKEYIPVFRPNRIAYPLRRWWARRVDRFFFKKALRSCDVFVFISDSFEPDYKDLAIIKEQGKKIVSVFVGDDVRWYNAMKAEFMSFGLQPIEYEDEQVKTMEALEARLSRIRTAEKYADFIFSRLDQAQLELRPYHRWNMIVTASLFKENAQQRVERPVVAHAPSSRSGKGTKYILDTFERLKREGYSFDILLIENVPNAEAVKMYRDADILVDQLLCVGAGKLATEALASGTIVLSNMSYQKYPQKNPADCPIIDVNPDTIYDKLKWLITNPEFRVEHAKKGRPYVEKVLDVRYFCEKVTALVKGENIIPDYHPDFLRDKYVPVSTEEATKLNYWTATVKNENWYKSSVTPGERDGLSF